MHFASRYWFKYLHLIAPPPARKTRGELMKHIDADYYGYRDEDDGRIIPLEQEMEKKGIVPTGINIMKMCNVDILHHILKLIIKFITIMM